VASTLLSKSWPEKALLEISDPEQKIRISTKLAEKVTSKSGAAASVEAHKSLREGKGTFEPSPRWLLPGGYYLLKPAASEQKKQGIIWHAVAYHATI
jgi:hypothetical protein